METTKKPSFVRRTLRGFVVVVGSMAMTLAFFLVLPVIQAISASERPDTELRQMDAGELPPPPPPPMEEEPEPEPEEAEPEPELNEEVQPLDLNQLELALNPGMGGGALAADFSIDLNAVGGGGDDVDALFSLADLDQKPRALSQPGPTLDRKLRKKAPGKVNVIFIVDERGRVQQPKVQSSTDPVFDKAALNCVKKWRFEPGKRKGQPVRFRMKVTVTFPKQ